jgi:PQQ-dependent dehydrogenase (s-GDH family)
VRNLVAAAVCGLTVFVSVIAQDGPETVVRGTKQFRQTEVVTGLEGPFEVTWGPDNMLWVTEQTGKRITRVNPATGEKKVAVTIDEVLAPGGQDGLLGMALDLNNNFVYAGYTYTDKSLPPHETRAATSPYRFLYNKIVRFTYDRATETLRNPVTLIAGMPAGNDHMAGRMKIGPDRKLYYTIGDMGNDQLGNYCVPIEAQRLPTQAELQAKNYASYVGKSLRLNLDGSIPNDNPQIEGVRSHVFTYGHRNPQGIDFGPDGTLYESEHGPKTDDEINILRAGANYGWPHVAGLKDNKAYEYARWAESSPTPCAQLKFSDLAIAPTVPREPESAFTKPFNEPIATMFTVSTGYNFSDPVCKGIDYICWPTVGVSSIEYYGAPKNSGIPGWEKVLLATTLKRGSLYVVALTADGQRVQGRFSRYFQSDNRYRDTAVSPDGKTIYIATDPSGLAEAMAGGTTRAMTNKGSILAFTYVGEGTGAAVEPQRTTTVAPPKPAAPAVPGAAPQYTAAQAAAGKTAFDADCAVCHGNTLRNGTMGPPLAGEAFTAVWAGRSVRELFDSAKTTMPPASPGSLSDQTYASLIAYVLQMNGYAAGETPLTTGDGTTLR